MTTKKATKAVREWRTNNPERYQEQLDRQAARRRAIERLIGLHPRQFQRLLEEEMNGE